MIVFHNEGNSTLLRTLTSIVTKSPNEFIQEIILVDDASVDRGRRFLLLIVSINEILFDVEYLKGALDEFVKELPVPVHILRNNNRLGLMKSRLKGKETAKKK